jgi:hypothetical protein
MRILREKLTCLFVLFFLVALEAVAQPSVNYFSAGINAGATNYMGDIDDDLTPKFTKPGVGIFGMYRFHPHMSARLQIFQGWAGADDEKSSDASRSLRNLSFRTGITEASAHIVYEFFGNTRKYIYRPRYTPYLFAGIGMFYFNPQAQLMGNWENLQPLGTEGQFLPVDKNYPEPYKLIQFTIPFGGGLRYRLNRKMDIYLETGVRKTFTDYLDDVSGVYPDMDALLAQNPKAFLLSDRSDRAIVAGGIGENQIRGFAEQKDWYIYTNIGIGYILDWVKCPKFK